MSILLNYLADPATQCIFHSLLGPQRPSMSILSIPVVSVILDSSSKSGSMVCSIVQLFLKNLG